MAERSKGFQHGVGFGRWRNSEGNVVDMKDMDDRYLKNCLNICIKRGNTGKTQELKAEIHRRETPPMEDPPYDQGEW